MIRVADEVWIAASLLHRENPDRPDFSVHEIVERAVREGLAGGYRPGLQIHASTHCVATKPPNPARHRMLSETGRGRRRLFCTGDQSHRHRKTGKTHPDPADIPAKYLYLLEWYEHEYSKRNGRAEPLPPGGRLRDILRFVGTIPTKDLDRMKAAMEEDCERIDLDEWRLPARH